MAPLASLASLALLLTTGHCQGNEASLEDLVYDYYAGGWEEPQGRSEPGGVPVEGPGPGGEPPAVKDEFGDTLTGMMGALAEIQRKGDSMLAGIRRQREVLSTLEERAATAERRRREEEAVVQELEVRRADLEEHVTAMMGEKEELAVVQTRLGPLVSQVSTRTVELRNFEAAIETKKEELASYGKKVAEVTKTLSDLETKTGLVGGSSPALLALLAGSLIFNLAAGSHLASGILAAQQREGGPDLATQFSPLREDLASFLGSVVLPEPMHLPEPMRPAGSNHRRKVEKRFKDKFSEEVYYDLPRRL